MSGTTATLNRVAESPRPRAACPQGMTAPAGAALPGLPWSWLPDGQAQIPRRSTRTRSRPDDRPVHDERDTDHPARTA